VVLQIISVATIPVEEAITVEATTTATVNWIFFTNYFKESGLLA
jgi:hypothetical protein